LILVERREHGEILEGMIEDAVFVLVEIKDMTTLLMRKKTIVEECLMQLRKMK